MKASELIGKLVEEILKNGDGTVYYEYFTDELEDVELIDIKEDQDYSGNLIQRKFILRRY